MLPENKNARTGDAGVSKMVCSLPQEPAFNSQAESSTQELPAEYLLAHLRAGRVRAYLAALEIDAIGIALKSNLIGTDEALAWLDDVDALRFLLPPENEAA